jgi:hypothetical protein
MSYKNHFILTFLIACITLMFSSYSCAKSIKLFDQPKVDAKEVGTVDTSVGIIPIFTPKDSTWIKVADPRNGDVGWIKLADLGQDKDKTSEVIFTQKMISGSGPQSFQIIQFGGSPKNLTPEQTETLTKQLEAQKTMQKNMQKMVTDMYKDINLRWENAPMILPIILIPQKTDKAKSEPVVK